VASVSVVGETVHASLEGLDTVLAGLGGRRLLMTSHCASDLSVTWVVPEDRAPAIVRLLHETLFAEREATETDAQAIRPEGVVA
jgi:aspartokinase